MLSTTFVLLGHIVSAGATRAQVGATNGASLGHGSSAAIVDGAEWPWRPGEAVDFLAKIIVHKPGGKRMLCTGFLADPGGRYVLTAAHCLRFRPKPTLAQAMRGEWPELASATEAHVHLADGTVRRASNFWWHPGYLGFTKHDVALLEIENAPYRPYRSAAPVEFATTLSGIEGHSVWVAGFGLTAGTGVQGRLHVASLQVDNCNGDHLCSLEARRGGSPRVATCGGDSGAPIFVDKSTTGPDGRSVVGVYIVGVNAEGLGDCGALNKYTGISATESFRAFLRNHTAVPYAALDWAGRTDPTPQAALRPWPRPPPSV